MTRAPPPRPDERHPPAPTRAAASATMSSPSSVPISATARARGIAQQRRQTMEDFGGSARTPITSSTRRPTRRLPWRATTRRLAAAVGRQTGARARRREARSPRTIDMPATYSGAPGMTSTGMRPHGFGHVLERERAQQRSHAAEQGDVGVDCRHGEFSRCPRDHRAVARTQSRDPLPHALGRKARTAPDTTKRWATSPRRNTQQYESDSLPSRRLTRPDSSAEPTAAGTG